MKYNPSLAASVAPFARGAQTCDPILAETTPARPEAAVSFARIISAQTEPALTRNPRAANRYDLATRQQPALSQRGRPLASGLIAAAAGRFSPPSPRRDVDIASDRCRRAISAPRAQDSATVHFAAAAKSGSGRAAALHSARRHLAASQGSGDCSELGDVGIRAPGALRAARY